MKLTITNATHFSTRALRGVILAVYRQVVKEQGETLGHLTVRVNYARTWGQAHGALGYGRMWLYYRKSREHTWDNGVRQWKRPPGHYQPSIGAVASDVRHELMHNLGFHHTLRAKNADRFFHDQPLPDQMLNRLVAQWGTHLPIRTPKPQAKTDVRTLRYQRVLAAETRWTTKMKRAQTALRKLRGQRRYYEASLAKAARPEAT